MQTNDTISDRFWSKVDRSAGPDACWPWIAGCFNTGYGAFSIYGSNRLAHVCAWYFTYGEWPTQNILHRCDNRPCCNPKCLFQGTSFDNSRDMVSKNRSAIGERHGSAKLTDSKVRKIRRLYTKGWTQNRLAQRYGVHQTVIGDIVRGLTWTHIL